MARRIWLLAAVLMSVWTIAALATGAHESDFKLQWALTRVAWTDSAATYEANPELGLARAGTPYPPPHMLLYAPLAMLPLHAAAVAFGLLTVGLAPLVARAVAAIIEHRLTTSQLLVALLAYPGFYYNLALGHNALLTLAILTSGWLLLIRRRHVAAGLLWSLLLYKPQWLLAVVWIPAVLGAWRTYAGLALGSGVLSTASVAAFGSGIWVRWLGAIRAMSELHVGDPRQIRLACDLRAALHRVVPGSLGDGVFAITALALVAVATWRLAPVARHRIRGVAAAGLLLTGLLISPHTMYYDATLFLLPVALLVAAGGSAKARWLAPLAGLYLALPIMHEWPPRRSFDGPPWVVLFALWFLALALLPDRVEPRRRPV